MASGFVDIHHHLLDGLDDGPSSFDETIRMLHRAQTEGVSCIAATPHMTPGLVEFDIDRYHDKLAHAQAYIQQEGISLELCQGAEVYYTAFTPSFLSQKRIPTLGNSWHVLIEFHPHESFDTICKAAANVNNAGYSMVLAHAERYRSLRWSNRLPNLRAHFDVRVQMNSSAVIKAHQGFGDQWIKRMLRDGVTDLISSDAHNTQFRPCTLGVCASLIRTAYGADVAQRLCRDQALEILHEKDY